MWYHWGVKKDDKKPDPFEWLRSYPALFGTGVNPKKKAFLTIYAQTGSLSEAARQCGMSRGTHYSWMQDEQYPEEADAYCNAFKEAHEIAVSALEAEARRRATEGVEEDVYFQGRIVGKCKKYSDVLLIFLLKGALPDKYKDRFETSHGGPVEHMSEEQLDAKIALLARKARTGEVAGGKATSEQPDLKLDTGADGPGGDRSK